MQSYWHVLVQVCGNVFTMGKLTFDCALLILVNRIYDEYLSKNRMNLDNIGILFSHEWVIKKKNVDSMFHSDFTFKRYSEK